MQVHLILEYAKGTRWGGSVATRANRFIVTRDESNSRLTALEPMAAALSSGNFDPQLLVISGINILEGQVRGKKELGCFSCAHAVHRCSQHRFSRPGSRTPRGFLLQL